MRQCLNQEEVLALVSIPDELSLFKKASSRTHLWTCKKCRESVAQMKNTWASYFKPEPDITSSLLKVYSRLKTDETLILKGWKLGEIRPPRTWNTILLREAWLFRGAVSLGLGSILGIVLYTQFTDDERPRRMAQAEQAPLAEIRLQDKNSVKVHYLQPELLQTVEFETTRPNQ